MKVKILGTGCPNCKRTIAIVQDVIKEYNIKATVEKVEDIMEIMNYDVMSTPAVVVDEQVKIRGKVPSKTEVLEALNFVF
jgi:small redox-active disulfide protein 2